MAQTCLSVKIEELDNRLERLCCRVERGRDGDWEGLCQEADAMTREYRDSRAALWEKMEKSRAGVVHRLADTYEAVEALIEEATAREAARQAREAQEEAAEERLVTAEYVLDFMMQAAEFALLVAVRAMADGPEAATPKEGRM